MNENMPFRSGGRILVDQLRIHGADTAFCVPGESFLDVLIFCGRTRGLIRIGSITSRSTSTTTKGNKNEQIIPSRS